MNTLTRHHTQITASDISAVIYQSATAFCENSREQWEMDMFFAPYAQKLNAEQLALKRSMIAYWRQMETHVKLIALSLRDNSEKFETETETETDSEDHDEHSNRTDQYDDDSPK